MDDLFLQIVNFGKKSLAHRHTYIPITFNLFFIFVFVIPKKAEEDKNP